MNAAGIFGKPLPKSRKGLGKPLPKSRKGLGKPLPKSQPAPMSQRRMAEALGVPPSTLNGWLMRRKRAAFFRTLNS